MRFHHSDMQNKVSVTLVPWETDEKSNGIGKGQRLLLFQSLSHSHFFTSSAPHSLVQPHPHSSIHSLPHSVTRCVIQSLATSFNSRPRNTFARFLHLYSSSSTTLSHSFTHFITPSSRNTFCVTSSFSHSLKHSINHPTPLSTHSLLVLPLLHSHLHPAVSSLSHTHSLPPSITSALLPFFLRWLN